MISTISNLGQLWFMVFGGRLNARLFTGFLGRLLRAAAGRKLFLIVDSHPAHTAAAVRAWLAGDPGRSGEVLASAARMLRRRGVCGHRCR